MLDIADRRPRLPLLAIPGVHLVAGQILALAAPGLGSALGLLALAPLHPGPAAARAFTGGVLLALPGRAAVHALPARPLPWDRDRVEDGHGARLRALLRGRLAHLDEPSRDLAGALVLGDRLGHRRRARYARAGILHLAAQSGLHVGIVLLGVGFLLGPLGGRAARLGAILAALAYVLVAGGRPGAFRALVLVLVSGLLGRAGLLADPRGALALTASGFLVAHPPLLTDLAAGLSFTATLGILHLGPPLRGFFPRAPVPGLATMGATGIAATLGGLPILAGRIGQVPLACWPTNLVAVPLGTALVPLSGLLPLTPDLPGWLAAPLVFGHGVLASWLDGVATAGMRFLPAYQGAPWGATPALLLGAALLAAGDCAARERAPPREGGPDPDDGSSVARATSVVPGRRDLPQAASSASSYMRSQIERRSRTEKRM